MTYTDALSALADPTRRRIYELLLDGPRSVGALAGALPVSQPAVSQHLKVLREAGLVEVRHEGARHIHRIRPEGLAGLRAYVESLWEDVLEAFGEGEPQIGEQRGDSP